jgi:hypothetical protein
MGAEQYKNGISVGNMTSQVVAVDHAVKLSPQMAVDIQRLSQGLGDVVADSISTGIPNMRSPGTHGRV